MPCERRMYSSQVCDSVGRAGAGRQAGRQDTGACLPRSQECEASPAAPLNAVTAPPRCLPRASRRSGHHPQPVALSQRLSQPRPGDISNSSIRPCLHEYPWASDRRQRQQHAVRKMEFLTFTIFYLGITAALVFIMLFGESPLFTDTPIASLHWLITQGVCSGGEWVASWALAPVALDPPHASDTLRAARPRSGRDREPWRAGGWSASCAASAASGRWTACSSAAARGATRRCRWALLPLPAAAAGAAGAGAASQQPSRPSSPADAAASGATLQIAYLTIMATGYYLFWSSLFTRLPTKHVGEEHM